MHLDRPQVPGANPGWAARFRDSTDMLVIKVNDGDKIDRALKQYKRKCNNTKLVQELRQRQEYVKPSVKARKARLKAEYVQRLRNQED